MEELFICHKSSRLSMWERSVWLGGKSFGSVGFSIVRCVFILFLFTGSGVQSQVYIPAFGEKVIIPYYRDYVELAQSGNCTMAQSDSLLTIAFHRYPTGTAEDYLFAAQIATRRRLPQEAAAYLSKAFAFDHTVFSALLNDSVIASQLQRNIRDSLIQVMRPDYDKYIAGLDSTLIERLTALARVDQAIRSAMSTISDSYVDSSAQVRSLWNYIKIIDNAGTDSLRRIIAVYGFPGYSLVGRSGNKSAWLLAMHADPTAQHEFLPLVKRSADVGETEWKYWAYVSDRVEASRPPFHSTYGCDMHTFDDGVSYMLPHDPQCMNFLRERLGLSPYHEYDKEGQCGSDKR